MLPLLLAKITTFHSILSSTQIKTRMPSWKHLDSIADTNLSLPSSNLTDASLATVLQHKHFANRLTLTSKGIYYVMPYENFWEVLAPYKVLTI